MKIKVEIVGIMQENTYFVIEEETKDTILIDPGAEAEKLISIIEKEQLNLKYIVLTHAHFDHIGACSEIKQKFNVPIVLGEGEEILLENSNNNLSAIYGEPIQLKGDIYLKDGEIFKFGNQTEFKTIQTTGHTPGGICLYFEKENTLFTGDTLFYGSIGRTDFPYGNSEALIKSLEKLKKLPNETYVYSGHGPKTTIGTEKNINVYMQEDYYY